MACHSEERTAANEYDLLFQDLSDCFAHIVVLWCDDTEIREWFAS